MIHLGTIFFPNLKILSLIILFLVVTPLLIQKVEMPRGSHLKYLKHQKIMNLLAFEITQTKINVDIPESCDRSYTSKWITIGRYERRASDVINSVSAERTWVYPCLTSYNNTYSFPIVCDLDLNKSKISFRDQTSEVELGAICRK